MIWHEKFVICSIPRTGTDIKSYIVGGTDIQGAWRGDHDKHGPLDVRWHEGMVAGLTFRRLKPWILSFIGMANEHGLWPGFRPKIPWPSNDDLFDDEFGHKWLKELKGLFASLPDRYLGYMTDSDRIPVDRYLRSEYIVDDMIALLRDLEIPFKERRVRNRGSVYHPRKRRLNYVADPLHYWSAEALARLVRANPRWMEIQGRIYTED